MKTKTAGTIRKGAHIVLLEYSYASLPSGFLSTLRSPTSGVQVIHANCRLGLYDAAPMASPFFSGHLLPPNDEDFSFSGSIAQRRTAEKTGWADAYHKRQGSDGIN